MRVELLFVLLLETEEDLNRDRSEGDVSSLCTATETERAESGCGISWRRKEERTSETTACVVTSKMWAETSLSPTWSFATPSAYAPISVNTLSVRGLTFCRPSETTHTTALKEGAGREEGNIRLRLRWDEQMERRTSSTLPNPRSATWTSRKGA